MRTRPSQSAAFLLVALTATACATDSYIESGHATTAVNELHPPATPALVLVQAQFYANGRRLPAGDSVVMAEVIKDLAASRMMRPVASSGRKTGVLKIDVNNRYDAGQATIAGLLNGLSLQGVRTTTRDNYDITMDYDGPSGVRRMGSYSHAILSTEGGGPPPANGRPVAVNDAFQVVIWQTVLDFLGDMQAVGNDNTSILFVSHDRKQENLLSQQ
jgi:hypothetical protein